VVGAALLASVPIINRVHANSHEMNLVIVLPLS
jgi:hypothetical protein